MTENVDGHPEPPDMHGTNGNENHGNGHGPLHTNGGRPSTPDDHQHLEDRRRQVERMDLTGMTLRAIAAELDVSHETIRSDLKAIRVARAEWWGDITLDDERRKELSRLEALYAVWLPAALDEDEPAAATMMCLRIADRKAKLMGLDQPTRIAGHDGGPLRVELAVSDELALDIMSRAIARRDASLN